MSVIYRQRRTDWRRPAIRLGERQRQIEHEADPGGRTGLWPPTDDSLDDEPTVVIETRKAREGRCRS